MQEGTLIVGNIEQQSGPVSIVIVNPTSGSYSQHASQIKETIACLRARGWQAELKLTEGQGDARRLARLAVEQRLDVVVAVGGDGTINEVIQELAGSETALGVLPLGTVNVWAREVGIPLDIAGARAVLLNGQMRHVDLGRIAERYFLLMAGIGMDGEITSAVEKKVAKRLGALGYWLVGTWLGLGYPAFRATVEIDGHAFKTSALQIIIGNTQLYGGAIKYTWRAKCDDGLLDICIVRRRSMLGRLIVAMDFILHREQRHQWVRYETGKSISIRTRRAVAMQIDGDPAGYTPGAATSTFTIVPRALKTMLPRTASQDLFNE